MIENANELTKQILLMASRIGARLYRRNIGMGWIGQSVVIKKRETIVVSPGDVVIRNARPFHNGEAGQFDTWGWKQVTITPEMVGTQIAQHVEIEIKFGKDRMSEEQVKWGAFCERSGVRSGVARTLEDAQKILSPE